MHSQGAGPRTSRGRLNPEAGTRNVAAQPDRVACIFLARFAVTLSAVDKSRFDKLHVKLFAGDRRRDRSADARRLLRLHLELRARLRRLSHRADEARLESMIERLEEGYAREGGWAWIANDRERWIEMSRDALGLPRPRREQAQDAQPSAPRRDTPLTIDPRLMLFDGDRKQLIGRPESRAAPC